MLLHPCFSPDKLRSLRLRQGQEAFRICPRLARREIFLNKARTSQKQHCCSMEHNTTRHQPRMGTKKQKNEEKYDKRETRVRVRAKAHRRRWKTKAVQQPRAANQRARSRVGAGQDTLRHVRPHGDTTVARTSDQIKLDQSFAGTRREETREDQDPEKAEITILKKRRSTGPKGTYSCFFAFKGYALRDRNATNDEMTTMMLSSTSGSQKGQETLYASLRATQEDMMKRKQKPHPHLSHFATATPGLRG